MVAITAVFIKLFCLGDKKKPASHTTKQHKELRQSGKLNYERLCLVGGGGICVAVTVLCYGTMGPLAWKRGKKDKIDHIRLFCC